MKKLVVMCLMLVGCESGRNGANNGQWIAVSASAEWALAYDAALEDIAIMTEGETYHGYMVWGEWKGKTYYQKYSDMAEDTLAMQAEAYELLLCEIKQAYP